MQSNKVTVIVVYKDYYQNFENCIMSLLNQTYKDIAIVIVDESDGGADKTLQNLLMLHPEIKLSDAENTVEYAKHFYEAENTDGKYLIFIRYAEVLTKEYISKAVQEIGKEEMAMAVSKIAFYFPKETINDLYAYEKQDYQLKQNIAAAFLEGASLFWGYYSLDNKLITKKLWSEAMRKAKASLSGNSFGCGEDFLLSYFLWKQAGSIVSIDEYSVLPWKNEDLLYTNVCKNNLAAQAFYNAIAVVNNDCSKESGYDRKFVISALASVCQRYIWRAGWAYDTAALNTLKRKLSELLGVTDFEFTGEAKQIEDNNKYIDLALKVDLLDHAEAVFGGKINIYVSMHKDSYVPPIQYLQPIQVGAAIADSRIPGVLYDDVGENISDKNKRYCELTAQYWAWKNVKDADYYGFWHYRRYFSFNLNVEPDVWGNINCDKIDEAALVGLNIDKDTIAKVVPHYDLILPDEWVCDEGQGPITILEHWRKHFNVEDITVTLQVIAEKYPQYIKYFNETLMDTKAVFCNLFIMKKELFEEYNSFCFGVLEEVEKRVDHSKYNVERYRTLGHIAERLLDAYSRYIKDVFPEKKVLYLHRVLIKDTKNAAVVSKIKTDKKCYAAVALACDDKYMPYTGALLQSIIENAGQDAFYDIVVMHNSISENNQRICKELAKGYSNVSIRFLDVSRNFAAYAAVHVDRHLTVETYFRFMIPDLFKEYDKVLYLDCDMVVNDDIAKLFKLDIGDNYVAATRDLDFIASCEEPERGKFYKANILKHIKIDMPENYFQAGVLLFNIPQILKEFDTRKLFEVALSRSWYYHDQDVLNYLFNRHIYYLDQRWNILCMLEEGSYRSFLFKEYLYAKYNEAYHAGRKDPAIIHYAGVPKPWKDLKCDLADYFWKYARTSPYYEQLLLISNESSSLPNGSLVFYGHNNAADNVGAPLFTVKCNANDWTSCYVNVEFMHLTDNDIPCSASRLLMTSRVVPSGGGSVNKVSQFVFENTNGADFFRNNVGYTVNADKTITIWARYANIFEGFAWRVLLVESRDLEKPSIIPEEQGILYTTRPLPKNLVYSK